MSTSEKCIKRVEREIVDEVLDDHDDNQNENEVEQEASTAAVPKSLIDRIRDKCLDIKYKILFKMTDLEFYFNSHPEQKLNCLVYLACVLFGLIVFMGCMLSDS
jgi:hypothetical protein